jgi:hypothetical protein
VQTPGRTRSLLPHLHAVAGLFGLAGHRTHAARCARAPFRGMVPVFPVQKTMTSGSSPAIVLLQRPPPRSTSQPDPAGPRPRLTVRHSDLLRAAGRGRPRRFPVLALVSLAFLAGPPGTLNHALAAAAAPRGVEAAAPAERPLSFGTALLPVLAATWWPPWASFVGSSPSFRLWLWEVSGTEAWFQPVPVRGGRILYLQAAR